MKRFARRPKGRRSSRVVLYELTDRLNGKKAMDGRAVPLKHPEEKPDGDGEIQDSSVWKPIGVIAGKPFRQPIRRMMVAKFMRSRKRIVQRVLIAAAVLLLVFWLFGLFGGSDEPTTTPTVAESETSPIGEDAGKTENIIIEKVESVLPGSSKGNAIVLATYIGSEQLAPVSHYFLDKRIETEILKSGNLYLLISKARFSGKSDPKYVALKRKIQQIGKDYKAPEGFKSFGFNTIYLLNVSNIK